MSDDYPGYDHEEALRRIPFQQPEPASWDPSVRMIGWDERDNLGVDRDRNLYWGGRRIEVRRALTTGQKVIAFVITMFTILAAAGTCASAYADLCQAGVDLHCPPRNEPAVKQAPR